MHNLRSNVNRLVSVGIVIGLLSAVSCTSMPPYRGDIVPTVVTPFKPGQKNAHTLKKQSVENYEAFKLAVVEFSDDRTYARPQQVENALQLVRAVTGNDRALVVMFVHGWGHNAEVNDEHLEGFRTVLAALTSDLHGRAVVGIYIGWRGLSWKQPFYVWSFPDRETLARRIGESADFDDLISRLNLEVKKARADGRDVVSVAAGHSLGGKILFESLEAQVKKWQDPFSHSPSELKRFGDLIVLVNAASDANDYKQHLEPYNKAATTYAAPILIAISSEADEVVGTIYHRGQWFKDLFKPDAADPDQTIGLGWKPDQWTHLLCLKARLVTSDVCVDPTLTTGPPQSFGTTKVTELRPLENRSTSGPFLVIRAGKDMIAKHSAIFGEEFRQFLVGYVARRAQR